MSLRERATVSVHVARAVDIGRTVVFGLLEAGLTGVEAFAGVGAFLVAKLTGNLVTECICVGFWTRETIRFSESKLLL